MSSKALHKESLAGDSKVAPYRCAIIGAGISGLALGWFLKKRYGPEISITIFEKAVRPGGWIDTLNHEGFLFEQGPRSLRPQGSGRDTLALIEELDLASQITFAAPSAYKRYLYFNSQLQTMPTGVLSLLRAPFRNILLKALWTDIKTPGRQNNSADESIYDFVCRRLGPQAAELLFDPFVSGIYAGDIRKLSMHACFPKLVEWEQQHRTLMRAALFGKRPTCEPASPFVQNAARQGIFTLKEGLTTLVKALAIQLASELKLGAAVKYLDARNAATIVELQDGSLYHFDHVFCAVPPVALSSMLHQCHLPTARVLNKIPSSSLAIVNIGYKSKQLPKEGFGYLIPSKEKQKLLGVVWDSSAFPQQNQSALETRLTAMLGGSHMTDFDSFSPQQFRSFAMTGLQKQLGIFTPPDITAVKIARQAIPQYIVGHGSIVKEIEEKLTELPAKVSLLGNGFYGISVNDCIHHAKLTAEGCGIFSPQRNRDTQST